MLSDKSCMSITRGMTIFSADSVAFPLLRGLKNIQADKIFLITPQNEATLQCKQISKVT